MKFSTVFYRWKGGSQPTTGPGSPDGTLGNTSALLGSDAVPSGGADNKPNKSKMPNVVNSRFVSTNGWPCYRIAVLYKPPSGSVALNADMYMYEDTLDGWFRVNATAGSGNLTANGVTFFDCVSLLDMPHVNTTDMAAATLGAIAQMLIVTDPGTAPNGLHSFALAADLTTFQ